MVLAPAQRGAPSGSVGWASIWGLSLMVSNGLLPKPDVGPALSLGVVPRPLPIRLEWRVAYRLPLAAARGEDFAPSSKSGACYSPRVFGGLFATACGGATWIAILPDVRGLDGGDRSAKTIFSPTPRARIRHPER